MHPTKYDMESILHEAGVAYAWKKPKDGGNFLPVDYQRCANGPMIRPEWRGEWIDCTVWVLCSFRDKREELAQRLLDHWTNGWYKFRLHPGQTFVI